MKLQKFKLLDFEKDTQSETLSVTVPLGSVYKKGNVLPDGIHLWYETPSVISDESIVENYTILGGEEIPPNTEFVDLLESVFTNPENNNRQQFVIFPLYKLK